MVIFFQNPLIFEISLGLLILEKLEDNDNWKKVIHPTIYLKLIIHTGKSFSEALILASTNPQYDKRLFIKIASSEHVVYINCSEWQNIKQFVNTTCSELAIFMY